MLNQEAQHNPVLIVGAGPSGLMTALMLARYGIKVHLIDKNLEKSPYSRAIGVQIRTLEIFSSLGIVDALIEKGIFVSRFRINTESSLSLESSESISQFARPLIVDQPYTEQVLELALKPFEISIERGVELIEITQLDNCVKTTLKNALGQQIFHTYDYVVGADGAHSIVRKKMQNSFLGKSYSDAFILADAIVSSSIDFPHDDARFNFKGSRFLGMIPMAGFGHYRLISVRPNDRIKIGPPPTIDEFQQLLDVIFKQQVKIESASWVSRFFVQCRSASHYQEGRIFLVGDAAHIHSPAGGQGMNTGLQDAFNLAFKLAMVIKGRALPKLLETYHLERKPVGDFLINYTDRLFRFMVGGSLLSRFFRAFLLPKLLSSKKRQNNFFRINSQVAIRYRHGCVCHGDHSITLKQVKIGMRVANLPLINSHLKKTDVHSLIVSDYFSLLVIFPKNLSKEIIKNMLKDGHMVASRYSVKLHPIFMSDYEAEKLMNSTDYSILSDESFLDGHEEPIFIMCRPDQHVFCFGYHDDFKHLDEELKNFLVPK